MSRTAKNAFRADKDNSRWCTVWRAERKINKVPDASDARLEEIESKVEVDGPCCKCK